MSLSGFSIVGGETDDDNHINMRETGGPELRSGQTFSEIKVLTGLTNRGRGVAWSPSGEYVVSGDEGGKIKIWETTNWVNVKNLSAHSGNIFALDFSPDGSLLASGSDDDDIKIWDTSDWSLDRTLTDHNYWVRSIRFNHDGSRMASSDWQDNVKIWNTGTWSTIQTLTDHTSYVQGVAWNDDSTVLATASFDDTAKVWDTSDWSIIDTLTTHTSDVARCDFTPDGSYLITGSVDTTAKVWDTSDWSDDHTLTGHTQSIDDVAASPDGTLIATTSSDNSIKLWDTSSWTLSQTLTGHSGGVKGAAWSPDSRMLATVSHDSTVRIWSVDPDPLIAHWNFDEASGSTAVDSSTYGNDGTITGATRVDGVSGSALSFDGNDCVACGTTLTGTVLDQVCVESWVKVDTFPGSGDAYNVFYNGGDGEFSLGIWDDKTVKFSVQLTDTYWYSAVSTTTLEAGFWYHLTGLWNSQTDTVEIYINGQLDDSESTSDLGLYSPSGACNPTIGAYCSVSGANWDYMTGSIDELKVFREVLTPQEITDHYNEHYTPVRDLGIVAADISFSDPAPIEGDTIQVTAMVRNLGTESLTGDVSFHQGSSTGPQIGITQGVNLGTGGSTGIVVEWIADSDISVIFVKLTNILPGDDIASNNEAYRSIIVGGFPTLVENIADIEFPEDTTSVDVIDLSTVFSDSVFLTYTISGNDNVTVSVVDESVTLGARENWHGSEDITFRATNTYDLFVEDTVKVTVTPVNDAPVLNSLPAFNGLMEDVPYEINLTEDIEDVDNDNSIISVSCNSQFSEIDMQTVIFTYPEGVTDESVWINISDGEAATNYSFELSITPVNDPPRWSTFPKITGVKSGIPFNFDLAPYITDPDNDQENITLTVDTVNGGISGTILTLIYPKGFSQEIIEVTASDGKVSVSQPLDVTLEKNYPPVIVGLIDLSGLNPDVPYTIDLEDHVSDPDDDIGDLSMTTDSKYASISSMNLIINVPENVPSTTINLSVSDGEFTIVDSFTVTVDERNDPPTIKGLPREVTVEPAEPYHLDLSEYVYDVDTPDEYMTVSTDSEYITVEGMVLTLTYPAEEEGETVTVTISDGEFSLKGTFKVRVIVTTLPPEFKDDFGDIEGIPPNRPYSVNMEYYVYDPDTLPSELTVSVDSDHATVDGMIVTFIYPDELTEEEVTFTLSDGTGTVSRTILITIDTVNNPPIILGIPTQQGQVSEIWSINLRTYIMDVDTPWEELQFAIAGEGASLEGGTVLFIYSAPGTYPLTLTVFDGEFTVTYTFNVTVEVRNEPPVAQLISPTNGQKFYEGESVRCMGSGSDLDGEIVSIHWFLDGNSTGTGGDIVVNGLSVGSHTVTMEVTDDGGLRTAAEVEIQVLKSSAGDDDDDDDDDDRDETDDDRHDGSGAISGFGSNPALMMAATSAIVLVLGSAIFIAGTEAGTYGFFSMVGWTKRKKHVLDNETRGMIMGYIVAKPGANYNQIKKRLKLQNGTLAYHLHVLENEQQVRSKTQGIYKRFYPYNMKAPVSELDQLTDNQRKIYNAIRSNPGTTQKKLAGLTGIAQPNVSSNLKILQDKGMVAPEKVGKSNRYYPVSVEERVSKNICPKCGMKFQSEVPPRFCLSCGHEMSRSDKPSRPMHRAKPRAKARIVVDEKDDYLEYRKL